MAESIMGGIRTVDRRSLFFLHAAVSGKSGRERDNRDPLFTASPVYGLALRQTRLLRQDRCERMAGVEIE